MRTHRIASLAVVLAPCSVALGQRADDAHPFAVTPFVGASLPAGAQHDALGDAFTVGGQIARGLGDRLSAFGDAAWSRASTKLTATDTRTNEYQYDLGLAWAVAPRTLVGLPLRPFVTLGAGVRDYRYESTSLSDRAGAMGFGGVGTTLGVGPADLRVEARDNLLSYATPTAGGGHATRDDVSLAFGVALHPHLF